MTFSVKPGSPIKTYTGTYSKFKKIGIFIKNKLFELEVYLKGTLIEYNAKDKLKEAFKWLFDLCVTGITIKYCIDKRNFLSYGLMSVLIMYYLKWIIELIKKPIKKD